MVRIKNIERRERGSKPDLSFTSFFFFLVANLFGKWKINLMMLSHHAIVLDYLEYNLM